MGVTRGWEPDLDGYIQQTFHRVGGDSLPVHLESRYGIRVASTTALDVGVVRIDRRDGPSWVARVFPAARPVAAAEGDARILQGLERQGFPAERCATADPVSVHEGQAVLVTTLVPGARPEGRGRTFGVLGLCWVPCTRGAERRGSPCGLEAPGTTWWRRAGPRTRSTPQSPFSMRRGDGCPPRTLPSTPPCARSSSGPTGATACRRP